MPVLRTSIELTTLPAAIFVCPTTSWKLEARPTRRRYVFYFPWDWKPGNDRIKIPPVIILANPAEQWPPPPYLRWDSVFALRVFRFPDVSPMIETRFEFRGQQYSGEGFSRVVPYTGRTLFTRLSEYSPSIPTKISRSIRPRRWKRDFKPRQLSPLACSASDCRVVIFFSNRITSKYNNNPKLTLNLNIFSRQ